MSTLIIYYSKGEGGSPKALPIHTRMRVGSARVATIRMLQETKMHFWGVTSFMNGPFGSMIYVITKNSKKERNTYLTTPVHFIVGQFDFFKTDNLFP